MKLDNYIRGLTISLLGLISVPVEAQSTQGEQRAELRLEEVIVSAKRREESLQDVPISLTAFTELAIERNMFRGISDYLSRAPGVSFVSTGARDRKDIAIRGVSNLLTTDSSKRVNTFAFYIDEFNVAVGTTNPQIMDMERIEVLRGPQGTYFGRNAIGGALNLTTKKPDAAKFYAEGSGRIARYETWDVEGILNLPIVSDTLAIRLNAKHTESDGNIKNINDIGGGNSSEYDYGRFALRFTPNERLLVDLGAIYTDETVDMREGVPSGVPTQFSQNLVGAPLGILPFVPLEDGVGFYPENRNRVNYNRPQEVGAEFYTLTARVEYKLDDFSIISVTGYIDSDQTLLGDIDGGSIDLYYETKPIHRDSLSQEFRLQSLDQGPWEWTVGAILARDRGNSNQYTFVGSAMPFGLPEGFFFSPTIEDHEAESGAIFGEATWQTTDRLSLTFGLRYTREELTFNSQNPGGAIIDEEQENFNDFSPKVALTYDISDNSMVYGLVSKGFKSGGVQVGAGFEVGSYDPEELINYEVGLKTELLDGRIRLNSALYYMDWSDLQAQFAQFIVDPNNDVLLIAGIQNAAAARSYGLETELSALITEDFTVNAGVGYLDAEFDDFEGAFIDNQIYDLSGYELPNSPKWTLSADAEYRFPVLQNLGGYVRAEWFYRDEIKPNLQSLVYSGFPWDVPSFHHVNLRAGIDGERYSLVAYIENALDENYYTNAYEKVFLGGMFVEPSFQTYGIRFTVWTN